MFKIFNLILEKYQTNPSKHQLNGLNTQNDILFNILTKVVNQRRIKMMLEYALDVSYDSDVPQSFVKLL
mgnify:FL=1